MTRGVVADFLREFADELDSGERTWERLEEVEGDEYSDRDVDADLDEYGERDEDDGPRPDVGDVDPHRLTLIVGGDSATVTIPESIEFDVEVASRSPMLSSEVTQEIEFELSWKVEDDEVHDDASLQVE